MTTCKNCGAALGERYCPRCGQDAQEPPRDARGLARLAAESVAALATRTLQSLGSLLVRPGHLTRAYLDGQRVRYTSPVQLYAWCTAGFFLLHAFFPVVRLDTETGEVTSTLSSVSVATSVSPETLQRLSDGSVPREVFEERFDAAVTAYFPILLIAYVAAAALLMAVQFWHESPLTHVLFALHWAAFYFVLEAAREILSHLGPWGRIAATAASALALAYLYLAMRRVYARSAVGTALRTLFTSVASGALLGGWLWSTTLLAERLA